MARQLIANFAAILKFDPLQPRDETGKWSKTTGRAFTSEEGYQWHEQGPGRQWVEEKLSPEDHRVLGSYVGFGYRQINDLRRGQPPTTEGRVRSMTPEEIAAVHVSRAKEPPVEDPTPPEGGAAKYSFTWASDDPWVVKGRIPDPERLAIVAKEADLLDDMIANRGLELQEPIVVERGAYLPGVSVEDLQQFEIDGTLWEEKAFTSTFLGDAKGRARSYPALGKWESIYQRYPHATIAAHQDEVGTAVRFYITLPEGTKVASAEAARRVELDFPQIQDPEVANHPEWTANGKLKPEDFTVNDYTQKPTIRMRDLDRKNNRSESEILLGSGARFKVTKVQHGYTYPSGDPTLKPVQVYEVHMEYVGGGSSDPRKK